MHVCTDKLGRETNFLLYDIKETTIAGSIEANDVTLRSGSSFTGSNPTFTLEARTSGGPPTTSTWTRDGVEITSGISLEVDTIPQAVVTEDNIDAYLNSRYISKLVVTGVLTGVYQYSASNRAMASPSTDSFVIEGTYYATPVCMCCPSISLRWHRSCWGHADVAKKSNRNHVTVVN